MTWIDELRKERETELRAELVKKVNSHCYRTGKSHKSVWADIYSRFQKRTGESLPESGKLDHVQEAGLLADLAKVMFDI